MQSPNTTDHITSTVNRRSFLARSAAATGALAVATPLQSLLAASSSRKDFGYLDRKGRAAGDYGPLSPVRDEETGLPLLHLPAGFRYTSFGWYGDTLISGNKTPSLHDGMAAFGAGPGLVRIVRNHEAGPGDVFGGPFYDRGAGGGTTTVEFDTRNGRYIRSWASLSGTIRNCAGGLTPWGSWLTCEESLLDPQSESRLLENHGYIFEVSAFDAAGCPASEPPDGEARPLRAMGRFVHEAVAVDPSSGIVYETEDRATSGFYRFIPNVRGDLGQGGRLQMLAAEGIFQLDTRRGQPPYVNYPVVWVDIDEPERAEDPQFPGQGLGVFQQGFRQGGAVFGRLEGAWFGDGVIYFVSTNGGDAGQGQVWAYDPAYNALRLIFESPSAQVLNNPDNLCVSPRGGLILCEDGSGLEYLHGLSRDGLVFRFAQNNVILNGERHGIRGDFTGSEFAGATFSPDGRWLFFNIQSPGITFAVTGPWEDGAL